MKQKNLSNIDEAFENIREYGVKKNIVLSEDQLEIICKSINSIGEIVTIDNLQLQQLNNG